MQQVPTLVNLQDIVGNIEILAQRGSGDRLIEGLDFDSRRIAGNHLFVAVRGARFDGHAFIGDALERGASAVICEAFPTELPENVTFVKVKNSDRALGVAAANFYGNPSRQLKLLGITGTNGKTTIATSLFRLFRKFGYGAGLLSTIHNQIGDRVVEATHTTPDAVQINKLMRQMVDEGCAYCFMEVSSHALTQYRTSGLHFRGGIFSNLSHDHLDYHETFAQYLRAKKRFFDHLPADAFALVNGDDPHAMTMLQDCGAKKFVYGFNAQADFSGRVLRNRFDGMLLNLDGREIGTQFIGRFNASNLLAVYAAAILSGQPRESVCAAISELDCVAGRFEHLRSPHGTTAIVDYAHTPDALENVLTTINQIRTGQERLITVVGAGGDRDKTKRPVMGRIAARLSDRLVLTSDNPRSEEPARIIEDMHAGVESWNEAKVTRILDRKEGITTALALAGPGDIVLVAGKGHETYQEVKGLRSHFDDREVIMAVFGKR